jgi:hypothetical protein
MSRFRSDTILIFATGVILVPSYTARAERDEMLQNFTEIERMVLHAGMEMVAHPPFVPGGCDGCDIATSQIINADVEFYASGDQWRLNSYADPALYPGMDTQIAWDGNKFQYFIPPAGLLSISTGELPQSNGVALPILLFSTLEHFIPPDDANPTFVPRLADVRQIASEKSHEEVQWTAVQVDGRAYERATYPGGVFQGTAYDHVVYVRPLLPSYPARIDRVNQEGQVLERMTFTGYDRFLTGDGSLMYWPTVIKAELLKPDDGTVLAEMKFIIRVLKVNDSASLPAGIFNIDWAAAESVFLDGEKVQ